MSAVPRIIEDLLDVAARLAALAGLTAVDLTEAVNVKRAQLDLHGITPISDAPRRHPTTHVLLIAHQAGRGVRAELSLPLEIGEDGRIERWAERIILPPLEEDGGEGARRGAER